MLKRILFLFIFFIQTGLSLAQLQDYNHPELNWATIETPHFYIHFHQGAERTARLTAKIAEDLYPPITGLYQYEPDGKIHIIVRDHEDYSNGFAAYYDNKIDFWAPPANFWLRGSHDWLRNLIAHEFSHMISLGAARKMPRQLQAVYLQWFHYEAEKRPDVIHGYPDRIVSLPLMGTVMPPWFAEGMAQFQHPGLHYDYWDAHRDMLLRTAVLENKALSLNEMGYFGKNSVDNERVYNQGYALTLFIAHRYGKDKVRELTRAMKSPLRISFDGAVKQVLGMGQSELYTLWMQWLEKSYKETTAAIQADQSVFQWVEREGTGNFYPRWSADSSTIAYLSSRGRDYMSQTSLWLANVENGKKRHIAGSVSSAFSYSPDGRNLVYAKRTARTGQGSHFYDLYTYNLEAKKEKRITTNLRARHPSWSPSGQVIAAVIEGDGTSNIVLMSPEGQNIKPITSYQDGEQIFSIQWQDSTTLIYDILVDDHCRDMATIKSDGTGFQWIIQTEHDERDPFFAPDGKLYFSSDETGIFNIYQMDMQTKAIRQITNVPGGVFMPAVNADGQMVFSCFEADGYRIARKDTISFYNKTFTAYQSPYEELVPAQAEDKPAVAEYNDRQIPEYTTRPYKNMYSKVMFLPRVVLDFPNKLKLGTYFYGNDFLDKVSLLGTVAANDQFDLDIFGIFQYKQFYPTLFLESYYQRRHVSDEDSDVMFDLVEVDLGADWRLGDHHILRTAYIFNMYKAKVEWEDQGLLFEFPYTYHKGNILQIKWDHKAIAPTLISNIAPVHGRSVSLDYQLTFNQFVEDFVIHPEYGTIVEEFTPYHYNQVLLDWKEYLPAPIKDHSFAVRLKTGFIDQPVDSFYNIFAGGLDGLKGYPYYSMEGRKLLHLGLAYRFPVRRNMNFRFMFLDINHLFMSVYGDIGKAWSEDELTASDWRRDVGVQLRLSMVSFYTYPLSLFFDASYGLDGFTHEGQQYGESWRTYFGILFDFLD